MRLKFSLSFFLFSVSICSFSQNDTIKTAPKKRNAIIEFHRKIIAISIRQPKAFYDSNYVKTYSKVFTLGIPIVSKSLRMDLTEKVSGNSLAYYPALTYSPGLFVNTSLVGFSIMPGFLSIHQNSNKRGHSDFNDYQLNVYAKRFFYDIGLQLYSGFYLNNTHSFDAYKNREDYYQRSDIAAISGNFNIYYVFNNKKFSYRAPFSFTQSQIKGAGSFIIGTYLSDFSFTADSSVVGDEIMYLFKNFPSLKSGNSLSTGLSFGYAYTYVLNKKFYVST